METMVLLVFLAIVWAGVGVYWLKTRVPTPSMAMGGIGRRPSLDFMSGTGRNASVLPLHRGGGQGNQNQLPGHSLTAPARQAHPGNPGPANQSAGARVGSEQARIRRRNVLVGLAGLAAITLVGVFTVGGGAIIALHLFADALLLGFVMLLVQYQREIELERTRNLPVYAQPRERLAPTGTDGRY